jgi:hypothetical protein
MASESKETRLKQKATLEAKLQKRLGLLAEKGLDEKKIARDALVKELKAKLKETAARLRAIAANVQRTAELAAIKAERLAKPKEETPKAKKAAQEEKEERRRGQAAGVAFSVAAAFEDKRKFSRSETDPTGADRVV